MSEKTETKIRFKYLWPLNAEIKGLADRLIEANVNTDTGGYCVSVTMPDKKRVECTTAVSVDAGFVESLKKVKGDLEKLEVSHRGRLRQICSVLAETARRFVQTLKFYLDNPQISETQLGSFPGWTWSSDGEQWHQCPQKFEVGTVRVLISPTYAGELQERVEAAIANDEPPYLTHAMRHLHRARQETDSRHRWIDTTIAAELGIKEFLMRRLPQLQSLLLEVPSPPLHKLYGSVLEAYAGERSPKRKEIQTGAEVRNKLIHRPAEVDVSSAEAETYVNDVEIALLHLTLLLHPSDDLVRHRYERLVERDSSHN